MTDQVVAPSEDTLKNQATKAENAYWLKLISQAVIEQAPTERIDAYIGGLGCNNPPKLRTLALKRKRQFNKQELKALGGRNAFRKLFGLEPVVEQPLNYPLTESGDAAYFANLHHKKLKFDKLRGRWLLCDEATGIWLPDRLDRVNVLARDTMRARQAAALEIEDHVAKEEVMD
jgi:hypothetical protein